ncbi:MAG: GDSL-type esterase/lipase family protein [Verrucomicrobiales bacterium]|nr:GDSL-type esterase/lipase family protein [Verrucomicrobiales bacterium]
MKALFCALLASTTMAYAADPSDLVTGAKKIVFLGDSNTNAGGYIVHLETALRQQNHIAPDTEVINLGLSSETCNGLSEPAHPFPRPNVHERLGRALEKSQPDLVFACYGMNDGIYYPFRTDRFLAFQQGITDLATKVKASGAKLVLLTPPPFDPLPLRATGQLLPGGEDRYDWTQIYENYDAEVIARFASWMLAQDNLADLTVDLHAPVTKALTELRKSDPDKTLSPDGVHLEETGHVLLADTIHRALGFGPMPDRLPDALARTKSYHGIMHAAWLSHVGHKRPGVKPGLPIAAARTKAAPFKP